MEGGKGGRKGDEVEDKRKRGGVRIGVVVKEEEQEEEKLCHMGSVWNIFGKHPFFLL